MITPEVSKIIVSKFKPILQDIVENKCFTTFAFIDSLPDYPCQYWQFTLDFFDEYDFVFSQNCGYFRSEGRLKNSGLGIGQFFSGNDKLMEEFSYLTKLGRFARLTTIFKETEHLTGLKYIMISVNSYLQGGCEWLRSVCEESLFILHVHESQNDAIDIGCMQSQRFQIKLANNNEISFLKIPFDKIIYFKDVERVEPDTRLPYFPYEVALSFAGEDRLYVYAVATALRARKIRVFYDDYEKVSLWGKDLYTHLNEVYSKNAKFCVLFISRHYREKVWTNHERKSAQARAFEEKREYILPARIDDTEIPGLNKTVGYIDCSKISPQELANLIIDKINSAN
ncbi:MAG: TIR domain-containing protein [Halothiobacillus sp.]|nr:TIR domain-containing protein [Halothiobacillus sp.]